MYNWASFNIKITQDSEFSNLSFLSPIIFIFSGNLHYYPQILFHKPKILALFKKHPANSFQHYSLFFDNPVEYEPYFPVWVIQYEPYFSGNKLRLRDFKKLAQNCTFRKNVIVLWPLHCWQLLFVHLVEVYHFLTSFISEDSGDVQ